MDQRWIVDSLSKKSEYTYCVSVLCSMGAYGRQHEGFGRVETCRLDDERVVFHRLNGGFDLPKGAKGLKRLVLDGGGGGEGGEWSDE